MNRTIATIACAIVYLASLTDSAVADPVRVRASKTADYGKIVFSWPAPVGHRLSVAGDTVVVRFNRPIEASYQRSLGVLSRYLANAEAEADGLGVRFTLRGDFEAYSYDAGNAVIVEFAQRQEAAAPQAAPAKPKKVISRVSRSREVTVAQAAQAPADLPRIRVRSGVHPDYTRLVFDWEDTVPYEVNQDGSVVTIRFGRAANVDVGRLASNPPRMVGGIRALAGSAESTVAIAVPVNATVRHFLSGSKVVVDVREPADGNVEPPALPEDVFADAAPPVPQPPQDQGTAQGTGQGAGQPASAALQVAAPEATTEPAAEPAAELSPEQASELPPAASGAPQPAPEDTADGTAETEDAQTREAGAGSGTETAAAGEPPSGAPTQLQPENREMSRQAVAAESQILTEARVSTTKETGPSPGVTLRFDWEEPVAAAVFRRVGYLWVVFDKPTTVNTAALEAAGEGMIRAVEQLPGTGGTILRMRTSSDVNPVVGRAGLSWLLRFGERELEANTPLDIKAQPESPVGARIFIPVPEPGAPVAVTDPEVGDNIVIVPIIPLGHGVLRSHAYPEVRFPAAAQGVVVQSLTDNLRVRPLRQGIEIASAEPLAISSVSAEIAAGSKLGAIGPVSRVLDLEKWGMATPVAFTKKRQDLERAIIRATPDEVEEERLRLAEFYFSNAFAAEALGVLRRIVADNPEIENDPRFRLLRGGSRYFMNRLAEAAEDFGHPSLDEVDEGSFWRAVVIGKSGDLIAAAHELRRTGSVTQPYPKPIRVPLGILVASAVVEVGDIQQATKYIDALKLAEPSRRQLADIGLIEGNLLEVGGDEEGAIQKWEEVMEVENRPSRVHATVARQKLLMQLERMEVDEAIEELETLRYVWRGGEFEFNLLRRLGGLYLDQGIYRQGLLALRQAATYYREKEEASQVTQQMSDTFNFLYLEDGANDLAPVTAIAIYEEFKELTPAGRQGDEMIRRLADRLVMVDLLEQAIELLEGQIEFRLAGVEKAQVGTNLALIHAIGGQFEKVVEVLEETAEPNIPEELAVKRRHLRARAMVGTGESEAALVLLDKDKTHDADLIRAELFWLDKDWANAAKSLRNVVKTAGIKAGQALTDDEALRVLNLATAFTLSGNERAVARLRQDHAGAMAQTRFKDAFALVAAPEQIGLIPPGSVTERVKLVTGFKTFLTKYKEKVKEGELSSFAKANTYTPEPVGADGSNAEG